MEVLIDKQRHRVAGCRFKSQGSGTGRLFRAVLSASRQKSVLMIYEIHDSGESFCSILTSTLKKLRMKTQRNIMSGLIDIGLNGDGLHLHAGFEIEKACRPDR